MNRSGLGDRAKMGASESKVNFACIIFENSVFYGNLKSGPRIAFMKLISFLRQQTETWGAVRGNEADA